MIKTTKFHYTHKVKDWR